MLNKVLNKMFPDRGKIIHKPDDNGMIVLPNGMKIKTSSGLTSFDIHQVVEVDDKFYCRRKIKVKRKLKWMCDVHPLEGPISEEEQAPIEPAECEWETMSSHTDTQHVKG